MASTDPHVAGIAIRSLRCMWMFRGYPGQGRIHCRACESKIG